MPVTPSASLAAASLSMLITDTIFVTRLCLPSLACILGGLGRWGQRPGGRGLMGKSLQKAGTQGLPLGPQFRTPQGR